MQEKEDKKKMIYTILIVFALAIIISTLWARFISTKGLIVKEYAITSNNLASDYDGLKIVHFSDLHYGSTIFEKELKKIIQTINNQKPDVVVFTGDLVENGVTLSDEEVTNLTKQLKQITPKVKIYAVPGNHDYEHNYWNQVTSELDWHILDNTYELFYYQSKTPIVFVGLDDLRMGTPDYNNAFSFINETEEDLYTIVLAHEPDQVDEFSNYDFDLVLSGHSHLGQIRLPFIGTLYTPKGSKKYYDEHYKISNSDLYISGGIGTSIIKFRFFNKPSINLYRFYTK